MIIETHHIHQTKVAEVISDSITIQTAEDALDLMGNLYYQGFDRIVLHANQLTPNFFDLTNGLAGEILQKFSNYHVRLAIVGDFSSYTSKSIRDFIRESNRRGHVVFVETVDDALVKLA